MKLIVCILALLAFAFPAKAANGTITITITLPTTAPCINGCGKTYTDSEANLGKIVTAYAPLCMAQNLQGVPAVPTACTPAKTLSFWFDGLIAGTALNVTNFLQQQQINGLTPIVPINPQ